VCSPLRLPLLFRLFGVFSACFSVCYVCLVGVFVVSAFCDVVFFNLCVYFSSLLGVGLSVLVLGCFCVSLFVFFFLTVVLVVSMFFRLFGFFVVYFFLLFWLLRSLGWFCCGFVSADGFFCFCVCLGVVFDSGFLFVTFFVAAILWWGAINVVLGCVV